MNDLIPDALSGVGGIRTRAMFGGHGMYAGDVFFGLIWKGKLYFRVDDATRPDFERKGGKPFVYSRDGVSTTMSYYDVPEDVLEDHEELRRWAERAIEASRAAKAGKKKKKK
jgi:DNA transformation protein